MTSVDAFRSMTDQYGAVAGETVEMIVHERGRLFMTRSAAACLVLLSCIARAEAADTAADQLDKGLQACLDSPSGHSTAGMVSCAGEAIRAWDKRLNEVYQAALKQLDPKSAELLRNAQRRWVPF